MTARLPRAERSFRAPPIGVATSCSFCTSRTFDGPRSVIRTGGCAGGEGQAAHTIALAGIPAVSGYLARLSATPFSYTAVDVGHALSLQRVATPTAATFCSTA